MPKLTDLQNSTITLLDYLYFHDILSMETFSQDKLDFYRKILGLINQINQQRGYTSERAELYKHYLLCGLELTSLVVTKNKSPFFTDSSKARLEGEIGNQLKKANFDINEYSKDLDKLVHDCEIKEANFALIYKLVSQVLCYEYDNISIVFLINMLDNNILDTKRYTGVKSHQDFELKEVKLIYFRLMLFIEFEISKRFNFLLADNSLSKMAFEKLDESKKVALKNREDEARKLADVPYTSISEIDLNKINDMKSHLKNVTSRLGHNNIFKSGLASWVGLIGAWHLILFKKHNLERVIYREEGVGNYATDTPCSEQAKKALSDYGFTITERTLFDFYDKIFDYNRLIKISVEEITNEGSLGICHPDLIDYFFYNATVGPAFQDAVHNVNEFLKK